MTHLIPSSVQAEATTQPSKETPVSRQWSHDIETQRFESTTTIPAGNDLAHHLPSDVLQEEKTKEYEADVDREHSVSESLTEEEMDLEIDAAGSEPPSDCNLVTWDGPNDPENPQNWPVWRKWMTTLLLSTLTLCITFASSVLSSASKVTAEQFGVSLEVTTLGTSLFILVCLSFALPSQTTNLQQGFTFGPLMWGPLSETLGRTRPLFAGFAVFTIFQIPVAVAQNLETIMLCRFVGGLFGSAPLAIVGGAMADFWNPVERGVAIAIFASATFVGPITVSGTGCYYQKKRLTICHTGSHCRRLYYSISSWLALDCLDYVDHVVILWPGGSDPRP